MIEIRGKMYITVAERVQMAHAADKGFEMVESAPMQVGDGWIWRCVIKFDGRQYIGHSQVHLNARPGSADATDPWACSESSACGRALGFAGLGSAERIASYDEIARGASNGH